MTGRGWIGVGVVCLAWSSACLERPDVGTDGGGGGLSRSDGPTRLAPLEMFATGPGTTPTLYSVWGASPADAWAVGSGGTALHYDGHTVSPVAVGEDVTLYDVWGTAADQVWAVGEAGTALRWSGAAWVPFPAGTLSTLRAVFATAPDDVWIGGEFATLRHFDGLLTTAASVPGLDPNATINDIHGTGPGDIWITGTHGGGTFASHFDGSSWSAPANFNPVIADVAASPNDVREGGSVACGPDDVSNAWRHGALARRTP